MNTPVHKCVAEVDGQSITFFVREPFYDEVLDAQQEGKTRSQMTKDFYASCIVNEDGSPIDPETIVKDYIHVGRRMGKAINELVAEKSGLREDAEKKD